MCFHGLRRLRHGNSEMKNFIKSELGLLRQRLAEIPLDLRQIPAWRVALTVVVLALLAYALYFGPIVPDLGYWVRYGSFPRR